jgi:predicted GIY-YIG superfamily endonuclease
VVRFLDAEEDKLRPFTASDITALSSMLGMTADELVSKAFLLRSVVPSDAPISAVYLLVETEQRECYVGSSVAFRKRVASHLSGIRSGKHENSSLERWSIDSTVVVLIAPVTREKVREVEQEWITRLKDTKEFMLTNERQSFRGDTVRRTVSPSPTSQAKRDNGKALFAVPEKLPNVPDAVTKLSTKEQFHEQFILGVLLPILEDESSSRDVLSAVDRAAIYDSQGKEWAIEFIKQYDSPWLSKLAASGRFPVIARLLA